jgi:TolA-binding protein
VRDQSTYRLAVVRFKQDKPREALQLLDEYLKTDPKGDLVAPATLLAGECRFKLGRAQEAARDFKRILDEFPKDPNAPTALLRLGDALAAAQDWAPSEQAFTEYLRRNPSSELWFQAQFGLGWARENQGRHAEAIDAYRRVTDKHNGPTAARAQFQIGECLFAQKKHQEAAAELLKVDILYAYPEWSAAALYEAGRCLEALGKPDQAAEQFRAVQDKFPKSKWAEMAAAKAKPGRNAPVLGTSTPGGGSGGGR